jgi:hypothetical protein
MDRSLHVLRQATQRNDLLQQISNSTRSTSTSSTGIAVTAEVHLTAAPAAGKLPTPQLTAPYLLAEPSGRAACVHQHMAL